MAAQHLRMALGAVLDQIPELFAGIREAVGWGLSEVPAQLGCVGGGGEQCMVRAARQGCGLSFDGGVDHLLERAAGLVQRRRAGACLGMWCFRVRGSRGCSRLVLRALN
ncbi:hypothetical protein BIV24_09715 [Streptomyces colonosanans]|uniref:Uncharacterized protein n=1 Tax=Streptomyces colonosanans TaxID=1428652 RepID=A0A1S2PN17_9ACTN|nr:hypothetical protein BIV24_09715 [Streptomyces colonosanans]